MRVSQDRSKGDTIVDYREGDEAVVAGIQQALEGRQLRHAYDAVSEHGSYRNIGRALADGGKLTLVLPGKTYDDMPAHVQQTITNVGCVHQDDGDFGHVYFRYFARGLREGWFKPQPHEVLAGGLGAVQTGLERLKAGQANAVKYVFRIGETDGAGA